MWAPVGLSGLPRVSSSPQLFSPCYSRVGSSVKMHILNMWVCSSHHPIRVCMKLHAASLEYPNLSISTVPFSRSTCLELTQWALPVYQPHEDCGVLLGSEPQLWASLLSLPSCLLSVDVTSLILATAQMWMLASHWKVCFAFSPVCLILPPQLSLLHPFSYLNICRESRGGSHQRDTHNRPWVSQNSNGRRFTYDAFHVQWNLYPFPNNGCLWGAPAHSPMLLSPYCRCWRTRSSFLLRLLCTMEITSPWFLPVPHCWPGLAGRSDGGDITVLPDILPGKPKARACTCTRACKLLFAVAVGHTFDTECEGVHAAVWQVPWQQAAWFHGTPLRAPLKFWLRLSQSSFPKLSCFLPGERE